MTLDPDDKYGLPVEELTAALKKVGYEDYVRPMLEGAEGRYQQALLALKASVWELTTVAMQYAVEDNQEAAKEAVVVLLGLTKLAGEQIYQEFTDKLADETSSLYMDRWFSTYTKEMHRLALEEGLSVVEAAEKALHLVPDQEDKDKIMSRLLLHKTMEFAKNRIMGTVGDLANPDEEGMEELFRAMGGRTEGERLPEINPEDLDMGPLEDLNPKKGT